MGTYGAQLTARMLAAVGRRPRLQRLAQWVARRMAGRHYVAALAVVIDDNEVLVARHRFRGDLWALPGGWVKRREDPAAACAREVAEELGIQVDVAAVVAAELHAVDGEPVRYGGMTLAYRCVARDPVDRTRPPRSVEISEVAWLDRPSCEQYLDGFQLAAIDAAFAHAQRA